MLEILTILYNILEIEYYMYKNLIAITFVLK